MSARKYVFLPVLLLCWGAGADSIKVGETVHNDVYVVKGSNMYYVSLPEDGTVLNVDAADVDPASVQYTQDRDARQALFDRWSQKNQERLNIAPPVKEEPLTLEQVKKDEPKAPKRLVITSSPPEYGYDPAQEQLMRQVRLRNMAVDAQRRQQESNKLRRLNSVRTYRSSDVSSSSSGMGGMNNGGFGNSGSFGQGNMGSRRR